MDCGWRWVNGSSPGNLPQRSPTASHLCRDDEVLVGQPEPEVCAVVVDVLKDKPVGVRRRHLRYVSCMPNRRYQSHRAAFVVPIMTARSGTHKEIA